MKDLYFLMFIFFAVSCARDKTEVISIVDDKFVEISQDKSLMSSIIQITNIIPLETNDSCLIGQIEKVVKKNGNIYVKSTNKPLLSFSETGKYLAKIGSFGLGPEEYSVILDFNVDAKNIYILTVGKIQIYSLSGKFLKSIPLSLNVSGFCLLDDRMLLFVLGDKHVIHIIDLEGKVIQKTLERNQALRLCKAIPFVRTNKSLLFAQGRSNDILMYDIEEKSFNNMTYFSSLDNLTIQDEVSFLESGSNRKGLNNYKTYFDGLSSSEQYIMFASISNDNQIVLWIKELDSHKVSAYLLSSLVNDLTFVDASSFFSDNTESGKSFLTYEMPYRIAEGLEKCVSYANTDNYLRMQKVMDNLDVAEANPIIIEYNFK